MLLALVMHRAIFGRGFVRTSALIPYGIVTVVAAFAWRFAWSSSQGGFVPKLFGWDFDPTDLTHGFWNYVVVIATEVWKTTPFMALLLLAGLTLVPEELHEAAKVDGASAWQRFWRITVPLMKPAILVALLFRTLDAFRIFDSVLHHLQRQQPQHRDGVGARLQRAADAPEPGPGLGDIRADLPVRGDHRLPVRQGLRHVARAAAGRVR